MYLKSFVFNAFEENTYVLSNEKNEAIVFDPGCYDKDEKQELLDYLSQNDLEPKAVINTHCHIDHVLGNAFLTQKFSIPLIIPEGEKEVLLAAEISAQHWGMPLYEKCSPDQTLKGEDDFSLSDFSFKVLLAPGHSPGHMMFYFAEHKWLIGGDVIFQQSIGRSDLPGGNFEILERSIQEKVYTLPDDTEIYPGHGPSTRVGYEKLNNPFVRPL